MPSVPSVLVLALTLVTLSTQVPAGIPQSATIDASVLLHDLTVLSADNMEGRASGTPGNAKARAYIVEEFRKLGLVPFGASLVQPVTLGPAPNGRPREGANVVGFVKGNRHPNLYLVITAHYDHLGVVNGEVYNGADDNASGVAALLTLATHFRKHTPEHSIVFAALDDEEGSGAGVRTLVHEPPLATRTMIMNINLDMISHNDQNELYAVGTYHYPFLKPTLQNLAAAAPVRILFGHDGPNVRDDWTSDSDQAEFHRAKIPFIYFGVENHQDYHRPSDDAGTITPVFFVHAVETILEAIRRFDKEFPNPATK